MDARKEFRENAEGKEGTKVREEYEERNGSVKKYI